ncbi:hypothetical protein PSPO01_15521 [Paraphaeosphaeria sporulosa]
MDALAEELLIQILDHLIHPSLLTRPQTSTLHALCLSSRKLYRLARPYLYTHIHSLSGRSGRHLLRTLQRNPFLASHVSYFAVQHTNEQFEAVILEEKVIAVRTIKLLSNLKTLDTSRCEASFIWWALATHPNSTGDEEIPMPAYINERDVLIPGLTCLHTLAVHLCDEPARKLLPFLKMPSLRVLEIHVGETVIDFRSFTHAYGTNTSVQHLRLIGSWPSRQTCISWLGSELINLRTLFLAVGALDGWIFCVVWLFGAHFWRGTVTSLQLAVAGQSHYNVEFVPLVEQSETCGRSEAYDVSERAKMYRRGKTYGMSCLGALLYAAERKDVERVIDVRKKYPGVRQVTMRELTEEEKKVYGLGRGRL